MKAELFKPIGKAVLSKPQGQAINLKPISSISEKTEAQVYDQGLTYNQVGLTYNQVGIAYGGVYGYMQVRPLFALGENIRPALMKFSEVGSHSGTAVVTPSNSGMLIGMLGLTYP